MATGIRIVLSSLIIGMSFAMAPVLGAEPTAEMHTFARMFTSLEARDLKGYCTAMHGAQYADYLGRVCQSGVQNKVKKPEECTQDSIAQQVKADAAKCLAMAPAEFDKAVVRGAEASKAFVKEMTAQGIDGEKLLQQERAQPEQTGAQYCEFSKGHVETLKGVLESKSLSLSVAMRASMERDIVASVKEAAKCCSDLDQCKRDFEAPAKKSTAK